MSSMSNISKVGAGGKVHGEERRDEDEEDVERVKGFKEGLNRIDPSKPSGQQEHPTQSTCGRGQAVLS